MQKISENGFIINRLFIEMMNMNSYLNEQTKIAKTVIDDLDLNNKEIDLISKDPEDFIYTYLSKEKIKLITKEKL